jgi:hypothetical protein
VDTQSDALSGPAGENSVQMGSNAEAGKLRCHAKATHRQEIGSHTFHLPFLDCSHAPRMAFDATRGHRALTNDDISSSHPSRAALHNNYIGACPHICSSNHTAIPVSVRHRWKKWSTAVDVFGPDRLLRKVDLVSSRLLAF